MPSLNLSRSTYDRLARKAAARNTTVEELVEPVLEQLAAEEPTSDQRRRAFNEWMQAVRERAVRYPSGYVVDDSRETIYEGRGE